MVKKPGQAPASHSSPGMSAPRLPALSTAEEQGCSHGHQNLRPCPRGSLGVGRRLWSGAETWAVTCPGEELRKHRGGGVQAAGEQAAVEALSPPPANSKWGTCKCPAQACNTSQLHHSLSYLGRRKTQFPCVTFPMSLQVPKSISQATGKEANTRNWHPELPCKMLLRAGRRIPSAAQCSSLMFTIIHKEGRKKPPKCPAESWRAAAAGTRPSPFTANGKQLMPPSPQHV